jgi:hypothetical protein
MKGGMEGACTTRGRDEKHDGILGGKREGRSTDERITLEHIGQSPAADPCEHGDE